MVNSLVLLRGFEVGAQSSHIVTYALNKQMNRGSELSESELSESELSESELSERALSDHEVRAELTNIDAVLGLDKRELL